MRRNLLLVSAAMYFVFGLVLATRPDTLGDHLGIVASSNQARTELRSFYGGLELGLAVFFAISAFRRSWLPAGCTALALGNGGIAAVRITGMIADDSAGPMMLSFVAVEVLLCALGIIAAREPVPTASSPRS